MAVSESLTVADEGASRLAGALSKVRRRVFSLLTLCYVFSFVNRVNISYATTDISRDLSLTAQALGFGAGVFFLGYTLLELPSNYMLHRLGAQRWLSRIVISWGVVAVLTAFVANAASFVGMRLLLGAAEAGFVPGVLYYMTRWAPPETRSQFIASWTLAVPISVVLSAPISGLILQHLDGYLGLAGWRWMFIVEGLPSILLGFAVWRFLPDSPAVAAWLTEPEREALTRRLEPAPMEREGAAGSHFLAGFLNPNVLILGIAGMSVSMANYSVILWFSEIGRSFGLDRLQRGLFTALPYLLAAGAMIYWSRRSDRKNERRWHTAGPTLLLGGAFLSVAASPTTLVLALASCVVVVCVFCSTVAMWTLPSRLLAGAAVAAGLAVMNSIINLGGFLGPVMFGLVTQHLGSPRLGYLILGLLNCLSAAAMLWATRESEATPRTM